MRVGDLIESRKEVYTVSEESSVHQVAQYLRAKEVRTVGVLGADGRLTGVISQSDISDKVAAENKCPAWMKASDIMTRELVTVTAERDRKSTRLNSSHRCISYAVFCLKKK